MQKGCTPERQSACCGECSNPKNVQELKAYLGLLTYYGKFLPDLSTKLASLYQVLQKNAPWHWREKQKEAFEASIELLTSSCLLAHINPQSWHVMHLLTESVPFLLTRCQMDQSN